MEKTLNVVNVVSGKEMVRQFGVELEGYGSLSLNEEYKILDVYFEAKSDGSLRGGDDEEEEECDCCNGDGYIDDDCMVDECSSGEVELEDSEGNTYCCSCQGCNGEGYIRRECEECDGRGYVYTESNEHGVEFVSPPITHTKYVYEAYNLLKRHDWYVDNTAGLHIHVDAEDYDAESYRRLLALMTIVEPVIYSITDRHRYNGTSYCKPITRNRNDVNYILDGLNGSNYKFVRDRYYGLNFCSNHDTVEFRYFAPQEEAGKVEKYVELVTKLVEFAQAATIDQIKVIVKKVADNYNFETACQVIGEVLDLSYNLVGEKENSVFEQYAPILEWIQATEDHAQAM